MANTNKGRKVYFCTTPQPANLDQSQFEALTWIEVGNVGSVGESGVNTNVVSYDELATDMTQKQKGISNAGDPTIECARNPTDAGQVALRAAAVTKFFYAFKFEDLDAPDANHTNTVYYNRGLIAGPTRPNGRNEDFILEVFTLGLVQREIVVNPQSLVAPVSSLLPSIAGVLTQGSVLTAVPGRWSGEPSFTYQWKRDGTNIAGATNSTYTLVAGDAAKAISVAVTGTNAAGNATATSAATANVT
ncbi:hypothetical protein [Kaistia nematophila]|uniref:Ig-like domain-containing protein n=1 Tax=Kaistia nematophila TaxID=2994654 RepID=A0A9X3IM76_9HYPH|nr:hypothetical protein [Kaistia nematophila]MCX5569600.1 hypothetical protein [Kaistia nematophila]